VAFTTTDSFVNGFSSFLFCCFSSDDTTFSVLFLTVVVDVKIDAARSKRSFFDSFVFLSVVVFAAFVWLSILLTVIDSFVDNTVLAVDGVATSIVLTAIIEGSVVVDVVGLGVVEKMSSYEFNAISSNDCCVDVSFLDCLFPGEVSFAFLSVFVTNV
jgi:hypothetical protein